MRGFLYGVFGLSLLLTSPTALQAAPAESGTRAISSDPEANATVKAPLYMIHVMFNNPVDTKAARMAVTDKNGKAVPLGEVMAMGTDGKTVMALPNDPLPPGNYKVKWLTKGIDGKALNGEFSFTAQ